MSTINVYELYGTNTLFDVDGQGVLSLSVGASSDTYFQENLNPGFAWQNVAFSDSAFPMNTSVQEGITALIAAINANPGPFVLIGWSQGAIVVSGVYDELRTGSLQSRNGDLLLGVTFGNPRRQGGHTFPNCPDPGGEGIDYFNQLADSETRWWDFANPGDTATCNDYTTVSGQIATALYESINVSTEGDVSLVSGMWTNPVDLILTGFQTVPYIFYDITDGPHSQYGSTTPLSGSGDDSTCVQIALDAINGLSVLPVSFSGAGSFAVSAMAIQQPVSFSGAGTGSFTVDAVIVNNPAMFSGVGSLSASFSVRVPASASFTSSGSLSVTAAALNVTFGEIGAGAAQGGVNSGSLPWSHTVVGGRSNEVGFIVANDSGNTISSATWNGAATTLVENAGYSSTMWCYKLSSPTSGTVSVACGLGSDAAGNSVTYYNVGSVGSPATATGSGTSASITFSATAGQTWFVFMDSNGPNSANSYTAASGSGGTWHTRSNQTGVSGVNLPLLFGDLAVTATGSCTVTVTLASSESWGMVAVPLNPL